MSLLGFLPVCVAMKVQKQCNTSTEKSRFSRTPWLCTAHSCWYMCKHLLFLIAVMYLGVTMALGTVSVCLSVLVLNIHHHSPSSRVPHWARVFFLRHCALLCGFIRRRRNRRRIRTRSVNNSNDVSKKERHAPADDPELPPDVMEIQNILSPHEKQRRTPETFMIKETLNYHDIDMQHIRRNKHERAAAAGEHVTPEEIVKEWQMFARVLDRLFFCVVFIVMLTCTLLILLSPFYLRTSTSVEQ